MCAAEEHAPLKSVPQHTGTRALQKHVRADAQTLHALRTSLGVLLVLLQIKS